MLAGLQAAAGKDRLEVVAVNFQDDRDVYRGLLRRLKDVQLTMTHDATGRIGDAYGVKAIPHLLVIGRDGKVAFKAAGYGEESLQEILDAVNGELARPLGRDSGGVSGPEVAFIHAIHHNSAPAAGWSSLAARRAHNPKVAGSNPAPATSSRWRKRLLGAFFVFGASARRLPRAVATATTRQQSGFCGGVSTLPHRNPADHAGNRTRAHRALCCFSGRHSEAIRSGDMTDKASEIAALLAPTVQSLGSGIAGRRIPAGARRRVAAPVHRRAGRCGRRAHGRDRGLRGGEPRGVGAARRRRSDQRPLHARSVVARASTGRCSRAAQFARFAGETAKVTLKLPQDGRRRLQGAIASVDGDQITFDVDGTPFAVAMRQHRKGAAGARLGGIGPRACSGQVRP